MINGLAYGVYLAISGEWRHIVPDRRTPREAVQVVAHDLHLSDEAPPQGTYNAAQRLAYTAVLVMAAILVVSGFTIYKPTQLHPLPYLFGGYQGARLTHFAMTLGPVRRAGDTGRRLLRRMGHRVDPPPPDPAGDA